MCFLKLEEVCPQAQCDFGQFSLSISMSFVRSVVRFHEQARATLSGSQSYFLFSMCPSL